MRMPKWLVVMLLASSAVATLGAAVAWWVAWPEKTARQFILLIREHRYNDADRLFDPIFEMTARTLGEYYDKDYPAWEDSHMELGARTVADVILGRQQFKVGGGPDLYFTSLRGSIRLRPFGWAEENLR